MKDWRDKLRMNPEEIQELSANGMAATRIMKSIGASTHDIGKLSQRFGIAYDESDTTFTRAVKIFREVYPSSWLVEFFDVMTGAKPASVYDDLLEDTRAGIIFYRIKGTTDMRAFVKGIQLNTSPLGQFVIKPGIRYIKEHAGMQLWEQEPVTLLKSFTTYTMEK